MRSSLSLVVLGLVASLGCSAGSEEIALSFQGVVADEPYVCGTTYSGLGSSNSDFTPTEFRLYVHDVSLINGDGDVVPLEMPDDTFQSGGVALLDFDTGCGAGNDETNNFVLGNAPSDDYVAVRFTLGVPFEVNHVDAVLAPSPLNVTSMWWNWNGGYKFMRVDGAAGSLSSWRFHLGSTGCDGDMMGNVTTCANENRPVIEIALDPNSDTIEVDLAELLNSVDLTNNQAMTPEGCMAAPADADCEPYFDNLGLPWDGSSGPAQRVFHLAQ